MTRHALRLLVVASVGGAIVAAAACSDHPLGPRVPDAVTAASGDSQTILVGNRASAPLVAIVKNSSGAPLANVNVNWAVTSGGGSLTTLSSTTDANGQAQTTYLSGAIADTVKVSASAGDHAHLFTIKLLADTVAILSPLQGNGSAALVGYPLTVIALATDRFGNRIPGVAINWSSSGGTLQTTSATTDSIGRASNTITVGPDTGNYTVTASSRFNTITFTVTAVASP
jgi:Big-like domain-containing protein